MFLEARLELAGGGRLARKGRSIVIAAQPVRIAEDRDNRAIDRGSIHDPAGIDQTHFSRLFDSEAGLGKAPQYQTGIDSLTRKRNELRRKVARADIELFDGIICLVPLEDVLYPL